MFSPSCYVLLFCFLSLPIGLLGVTQAAPESASLCQFSPNTFPTGSQLICRSFGTLARKTPVFFCSFSLLPDTFLFSAFVSSKGLLGCKNTGYFAELTDRLSVPTFTLAALVFLLFISLFYRLVRTGYSGF